jgi:hypothetical protein
MVARASDPAKRPRGWTLHTLPADEVALPETPQSGPAAVLEASTDLCGRLLGARYDVKELLSHGERGAVYLAHDRNYGRTVALRLSAPQAALPTGEDVRALARRRMGVRHPHLAAVQGEGLTEGGLHYVAMEHVEGRNLHAHDRRPAAALAGDPHDRRAGGGGAGRVARRVGDPRRRAPGQPRVDRGPRAARCASSWSTSTSAARAADSPYLPPGFSGERDSSCDVYALVASLYELSHRRRAPSPDARRAAWGPDELPEWFAQLLRTVLRTGSAIPSARGLLASLRRGCRPSAVTSVP